MANLLFVSLIIVAAILLKITVKRVTVFEYEMGLKYTKGKFKEIIAPGQYWYTPIFSTIRKTDIRPRFVSITGQEVLSSDGVTLKVSLAARYQITDPNVAINKVHDYLEGLYLELQLALREIIGTATIDDLLENRDVFSKKLVALTEDKIQGLGLKLMSVNVKDIMLPGQLKQIFSQVVKARKEGEAALARARG